MISDTKSTSRSILKCDSQERQSSVVLKLALIRDVFSSTRHTLRAKDISSGNKIGEDSNKITQNYMQVSKDKLFSIIFTKSEDHFWSRNTPTSNTMISELTILKYFASEITTNRRCKKSLMLKLLEISHTRILKKSQR